MTEAPRLSGRQNLKAHLVAPTSPRVVVAPATLAAQRPRSSRLAALLAAKQHRFDLFVAAAIRVAMVALQLGAVALMRAPGKGSAVSRLTIWDGRLYAGIAAHGYPHAIALGQQGQLARGDEFAFFPLYPALTWLLVHSTFLGYSSASLVLAFTFSTLLGPLIFQITKHHSRSRQAAYLAVVVLGVLPMAVVFQMAYAEALFTALSLAAYACAQRGHWGRTGTLLLLAGLTRPVAYIVAAGVFTLGIKAWLGTSTRSRNDLIRIVCANAMGVVAAPAFWLFTALRTHDATAWFDVQRAGWNTTFDYGASTYHFMQSQVFQSTNLSEAAIPCAVVLLGYLILALITAKRSLAPYAVIITLGWATVVLSSNYWHSKPRLLLVCALAAVPLATWLARCNTRVITACLTFAACISFWFGAFMITQWPFAI